jgi:hypothetical protein
MHVRATVGGEISAVAGPVGVGGLVENDGKWNQAKYATPMDSSSLRSELDRATLLTI